MKPYLTLVCLMLVLGSAKADPATPAATTPAAGVPAPQEEKKTELDLRMDRVGKAFKKLRKQVADPAQNASSIELVSTMQDAMKEALELTPERAADIPKADRPKFMQDYKAGINGMLDLFASLKAALVANDTAGAQKVLSQIGPTEKKDHKQFQRPE